MIARLPFFPTPLEDETLFSVVSRYFVISGMRNSKRILKDLFGAATLIPSSTLPSHIGYLAKRVPERVLGVPQDVIENHTIFPYFRPFLLRRAAECTPREMISNDAKAVKVRMGLVASTISDIPRPQYCSRCTLQDLSDFGTTYWHRSHQLPGVLVCWKHGNLLQSECKECVIDNVGRHDLFLPRLRCPQGHTLVAGSEEPPAEIRKSLQAFAVMSRALLLANLPWIEPSSLRTLYLDAGTEHGMVFRSGRVDQANLRSTLALHYPAGLLDLLESPVSNACDGWLQALVRKPRKATHPVRHLLLIGMLFRSLDVFCARLMDGGGSKPQSTTSRSAVVPWQIGPLLDQGLSLRKISETTGVSVTTLRIRAEREGRTTKRRRKKLWVDENQILDELSNLQSIPAISRKHKVSRSYVMRLLRSHPSVEQNRKAGLLEKERNRRRQILMAELGHKRYSPTEVKHELAGTYTWLRRHDRKWLYEVLNSNCKKQTVIRLPRIDWTARDDQTAQSIEALIAKITKSQDKVRRITIGFIGRRLGIGSLLDKHLSRMPQTKKLLASLCETVDAFQARRVRIAAKFLGREGLPVVEWRIKRLAGLKSEVSPAVQAVIDSLTKSYAGGQRLKKDVA